MHQFPLNIGCFLILGITDRKLIHQAINACSTTDGKYEVAEVVNMLIADESPEKKPALPTKVNCFIKYAVLTRKHAIVDIAQYLKVRFCIC